MTYGGLFLLLERKNVEIRIGEKGLMWACVSFNLALGQFSPLWS